MTRECCPMPCSTEMLEGRQCICDTAWCCQSAKNATCRVQGCEALGQLQTLMKDAGAEGHLSGVQVLIATAITGVAQALVGGQPLLIVGVAEPIVLIYSFMYQFAKGGHHSPLK